MNQWELDDWINYIIPKYMIEAKLPGLSLAVVKNGETIYAEGFGSRDIEKNLPATPDTLYGIGSITKSFVAIGMMQLVEHRKIKLNEPVSEYVPFTLGLKNNPITIHHLLTHSLGIPSLGTSSIAFNRAVGFDTGIPFGSQDDFYRLVNAAGDEIVDEPGKRFFYHNAAWRILGHIIQKESGIYFHEYIKDNILNKLGMNRSTLNTRIFKEDSDHITPYWKKPDGSIVPTDFPYPSPEDNPEFSFMAAAGGITSSVNEMGQYLNVLMKKEPGIITSESLELMKKLHIHRENGYYGEAGYGYGLGVTPDFHGRKLISHGGSILVSTAHMSIVPEENIGAIVMGNSAKIDYESINESILALLMGLDPFESTPGLYIRKKLKDLTGVYETYKKIESVEVKYKGGMLYLDTDTPFAKTSTPLIPESPTLEETKFYTIIDGIKSPVIFKGRDLFVERYCYHKKYI